MPKHQRRGGRGIRPWFLIPKVIAVAIWLGGLLSGLGVALTARQNAIDSGQPVARPFLDALHTIFVFIAVPGLLLAMLFGTLLFLQHPRQFLRMRWIQVKVAMVAIVVPVSHFTLSAIMTDLRAAIARGETGIDQITRFTLGLTLAFAAFTLIAILGRLKPRLGQNWAKAYEKSK